MKWLNLILLLVILVNPSLAQYPIRDVHITNQQERMVFKQWSRSKFTPRKGWLGLNPLYWLTWGLHPDYPKKDLRPLGPIGPQTQRMAMVLAMEDINNSYKLHSDTLKNTAVSEAINYAGFLSEADPLWILYYRYTLFPLVAFDEIDPLAEVPEKEKAYLLRVGSYEWYREEAKSLAERLQAARTITLDRGSRMLTYHRLLGEYRKLSATWETKKQNAKRFLALAETQKRVRQKEVNLVQGHSRSDRQIADAILSKSKL
jgi:hypothetical protein